MEEDDRDISSYQTPSGAMPTSVEMGIARQQYDAQYGGLSDNDVSLPAFLDTFFGSVHNTASESEVGTSRLDDESEEIERVLSGEGAGLSSILESKLVVSVPVLLPIDGPCCDNDEDEILDTMNADGIISGTKERLFRRTLYNFIVRQINEDPSGLTNRGTEVGHTIASNFLDAKGRKRNQYYIVAAHFLGGMFEDMPTATPGMAKEKKQFFRIVGTSEDVIRGFKSVLEEAAKKGDRSVIVSYGAEQARRLVRDKKGISKDFYAGIRNFLSAVGFAMLRRNNDPDVVAAFSSHQWTENPTVASVSRTAPLKNDPERKEVERIVRELFGGTAVQFLVDSEEGRRLRTGGRDTFSLLIPKADACPKSYRDFLKSAPTETMQGIVKHHLFAGRLDLSRTNHTLRSLANKTYSLSKSRQSGKCTLESHQVIQGQFLDDDDEEYWESKEEGPPVISISKQKIRSTEDRKLQIVVFYASNLLD